MGSEAFVTGRNIISDMARNTDTDAKIRDIVRRNVTELALRVINKLIGRGRRRKRDMTSAKIGGKFKKAKIQTKAKKKQTKAKGRRRKKL